MAVADDQQVTVTTGAGTGTAAKVPAEDETQDEERAKLRRWLTALNPNKQHWPDGVKVITAKLVEEELFLGDILKSDPDSLRKILALRHFHHTINIKRGWISTMVDGLSRARLTPDCAAAALCWPVSGPQRNHLRL